MKIITFGLQQWLFLGSLPVESHAGLCNVCVESFAGWWGWNERKEPEKEESVGRHKYIFTFYEIVAKTPPTIEIDMKDLYLFDAYVLILLSEVCYMQ